MKASLLEKIQEREKRKKAEENGHEAPETAVAEVKEEVQEEQQQPVEEKPKKRKRRTKKEIEEAKRKEEEAAKANSNEEASSEEEVDDPDPDNKEEKEDEPVKEEPNESVIEPEPAQPLPTTEITFLEAASLLSPSFDDPDWVSYKAEIEKELGEIKIDQDMNPGMVRETLAACNNLEKRIFSPKDYYTNLYNSVAAKDDGLLETIKKTNIDGATNDMERRKRGLEACLNYDPGTGVKINLIEYRDEMAARANFLKNVNESIKYKSSLLLTMLSTLKLENQIEQQ